MARGHILRYFNQIFDGLCKLFADVDIDVKNGANLLDRLIKVETNKMGVDFELDVRFPRPSGSGGVSGKRQDGASVIPRVGTCGSRSRGRPAQRWRLARTARLCRDAGSRVAVVIARARPPSFSFSRGRARAAIVLVLRYRTPPPPLSPVSLRAASSRRRRLAC